MSSLLLLLVLPKNTRTGTLPLVELSLLLIMHNLHVMHHFCAFLYIPVDARTMASPYL